MEGLYECSRDIQGALSITLIEHSNQASIEPPRVIEELLKVRAAEGKGRAAVWQISGLSKAVTHSYEVNFCSQQYSGP